MKYLLLTITVMFFCMGSSYAQIKAAKNVEFNESSYVVSDSAVFVYFIKGQSLPYKIYDFSTQAVYVYFGGDRKKQLATHEFASLAQGEIEYILKIGCDNTPLNSGFRRFCK